MEGMSEVFLESEDSREKHRACKSEPHSLYHAYQKQVMQNSMDIDILKE